MLSQNPRSKDLLPLLFGTLAGHELWVGADQPATCAQEKRKLHRRIGACHQAAGAPSNQTSLLRLLRATSAARELGRNAEEEQRFPFTVRGRGRLLRQQQGSPAQGIGRPPHMPSTFR